jgi:O-succinylbenzoic acid--CoA ligase
MIVNYPHPCIWINGRNVLIKDICSANAIWRTNFEETTFGFIREWFSDQQKFVLNTSGSTGTPKTITISREQMIASASLTASALNLSESMNALVCLDTKYIAGKMMLVRCFHTGMKILAVEPSSNPLCKVPIDKVIHFAALVPLQAKSVIDSNHPHLLDGLNLCIIGGAPIDEDLHSKLQRYSPSIYATYGMTETISHIALQRVNGEQKSDFFRVFPGITIKADDRSCLIIQTPHGDTITTNDIVEITGKSEFKWLGRWDNVINSGGIKLSPENIERKIGQIFTRLHINNHFFVHGIPDTRLGQKLVLIVESPLPVTASIHSISEEIAHSFPSYEIPKEIFESAQFIYTPTNKINRAETFKSAAPATAKI